MIRPIRSHPFVMLLLSLLFSPVVYAQSEATAEYSVTFTGNWTLASTPGGVVSSAHFTTIAGGKHNSSVSFWSSGATATSGLEGLAELGSTSGFISEINASTHTDASFTSGVSGGGTGTSTFTLTVKKTHPLITLASMIGPSPDWFVGIHDFSLLDSSNNWKATASMDLFAYDAGTEDGTEFTLSNPPTSPQGVITSLKGIGKFSNVRMASISFTRQNTPPPPQTPPTITAIERPSGTAQTTNADSVTWLVTFSESVQNVSTDDFIVNGTTAAVSTIELLSGSSTQYQLVVSDGNLANLNGTISLGLSIDQNITNSSNVSLSTTLPSTNETYIIDNIAPYVTSVSPASTDESPFTATITFSESLRSNSFSDTGDVLSEEADVTAPIGSGTTYQVIVTPNDASQATTISLAIPNNAGTDVAGNASEQYQTNIGYTPAPDRIPPVVESVAAITTDGLYHTGEQIEIGVTFSKTVVVSGIPNLVLQFDNGVKNAAYTRGSDSNLLVFTHTLATGDSTSDLGYVSAQSLVLGNGSIVGTPGQLATLTLPSPGSVGSLRQNSDIRTSGRQDAMPLFGSASINDQVLMMNQLVEAIQLPAVTSGDDPIQYSLNPSLPAGLQLHETTHVISGTPINQLNRTTFTWTATDADGDTVSLTFTIMILARMPLQFPSSAAIDDQLFLQNDQIEPIELPAARGGIGALTYSLSPELPTGLMLDLEARQVSGTPTVALAQTTYNWQVTDEEGTLVELSFKMTVRKDFQPVFDEQSPPIDVTFIQNSKIAPFTLPTATGGNGYLTHTLQSQLPDGLSLDPSSFKISGTPTTAGSRSVLEWVATDEDGDSTTYRFAITVLEDLMPSFAADEPVAEKQFVSRSLIEPFQLPSATSGNGKLSYSLSPDLPIGLNLDSNSFDISGTPTEATPRTQFTWLAQDEDGDSTMYRFYITVLEDQLPSFATDVAIGDYEFISDSMIKPFTLPSATGGNGTLEHNLTPDLPSGLSLDSISFEISGTPSEAVPRTQFTWSAHDEDGDATTYLFFLTVLEDRMPSFATDTSIGDFEFISGSLIEPFKLPTAMGGNGELTYSLSPDLPSDLSLDSRSFEISGAPNEAMPSTQFTWTAHDEDGDSTTYSFFITVLQDEMPAFAADAVIAEQEFISGSLIEPFKLPTAKGGNGMLIYNISPELPSGLNLDTDSFEISGIPTEAMPRTQFAWSAQDQDGDSTTIHFFITVIQDEMPAFVADASIDDQAFVTESMIEPFKLPSATGGNGTLSFSLSPELPNGLSLDSRSFEVSGTPISALPRTLFTWSVHDEDGDEQSISFYLTVNQDTQPIFDSQVANKVFVMGTEIEPFVLPRATDGNGELTYELTPRLPEGLNLDASTGRITGAPTAEATSTTYHWTVIDADGDSATLSFAIVVQPAVPEIIGSLPEVRLVVGGSPQSVDASGVVAGKVQTWEFNVADPTVATVTSGGSGVFTISAQIEGQTNVSVQAANVTGMVEVSFLVIVMTDAIEYDQIDSMLSLNAGALLSSAMNVFKHRTNDHRTTSNRDQKSSSFNRELNALPWNSDRTPRHHRDLMQFEHDLGIGFTHRFDAGVTQPGFNSAPLNFSHASTPWGVWGAIDLQNFSSDASGNEIDGSISSLFVGADLAMGENVLAGLAVAHHGGSSSFEFASAEARGEGELDTTLLGLYPYIRATNGNRFAMYLVGGIAYGDTELTRQHARGMSEISDTDLSLFAGGFDFVVGRWQQLDVAIVADFGIASLTTESGQSLLSDRTSSSSKSSIGGSVSFSPEVENSSLAVAADLRFARGSDSLVTSSDAQAITVAENEHAGSGFEFGANLNYASKHIELMLDGRTTSRSAVADVQRTSITARLRYNARRNGTGLSFTLSPRWQDGAILSLDDGFQAMRPGHSLSHYNPNASRAIEMEVGYGFLGHRNRALLKPTIAWHRFETDKHVFRLGTEWHLRRSTHTQPKLRVQLYRKNHGIHRDPMGIAIRLDARL